MQQAKSLLSIGNAIERRKVAVYQKCKGCMTFLGPGSRECKTHCKASAEIYYFVLPWRATCGISGGDGLKCDDHVRLRQALDSMIGTIHVLRRIRRHGTLTSMQCDETFFSTRKRGGNNRTRRVRREGPQVAQTIVETTRQNKISEIFMDVVPIEAHRHLFQTSKLWVRDRELGSGLIPLVTICNCKVDTSGKKWFTDASG